MTTQHLVCHRGEEMTAPAGNVKNTAPDTYESKAKKNQVIY